MIPPSFSTLCLSALKTRHAPTSSNGNVITTSTKLTQHFPLVPGAHHPTKAVDPSFVPVSAVLHRSSSNLDSLAFLCASAHTIPRRNSFPFPLTYALWKSPFPQCENSWQRCCDDQKHYIRDSRICLPSQYGHWRSLSNVLDKTRVQS